MQSRSSSAGQRLLLLHSGFIGIEIFHSLVKVQVVEKPKCSWARQGRRKLRVGKVHHGRLGSKVRVMRVTPVWCWEKRPWPVLPLPPCSGPSWETQFIRLRMVGNTELLKSYHFIPPWNPFNAFQLTAAVSCQIYTHSLCYEQCSNK